MRRAVMGVVLLCFAVYLLNGRALPEVDCVAAPYMAWSLARHGSYTLQDYPDLKRYVGESIKLRADSAWVSMRPPGSALVALPLTVPLTAFREVPLRDQAMHQIGKLAAALCVSGAAALFFLTCKRLAPSAAWPATLLFALGTCLYSVASQALWMHGPAVFWLCLALYCLNRPDSDLPRCQAMAGFALGFAVLTRPTTAFFFLATAAALLLIKRQRGLIWLGLGALPPLLVLLHYNLTNFGSPFLGGYKNDQWQVSPPLWLGVSGLLIAPSRGAFVYSPALLLAFPGAWRLTRRSDEPENEARILLLSWLAASGVTLLFFARWHDWQGGWCYGPRFLCETMPVLCLLFANAYERMEKAWQRQAACFLIGLSICIHLLGVFGYSGYEAWQRRHDLGDQGRCLFALQDTQIEAHARALFAKLRGVKHSHP